MVLGNLIQVQVVLQTKWIALRAAGSQRWKCWVILVSGIMSLDQMLTLWYH